MFHRVLFAFCLLAVAGPSMLAWSSPAWRQVDSPATGPLVSAAFGNDVFVAVGESIVYSTDTVHWHESPDGDGASLNQVIFAEDRFFAVGYGNEGVPLILTSTDGGLWSEAELPDSIEHSQGHPANLRSIAFQDGTWVVVGYRGIILKSDNGDSWTEVAGATSASMTAIVATKAGFTAFGNGWVLGSVDGNEWEVIEYQPGRVAQAVFAEGRIFGRDEQSDVWSSLDGQARLRLDPDGDTGIGHAAGLFVRVLGHEFLLSRDLGDWARYPSSAAGSIRAVAASEDAIVAVGGSGPIFVQDGLWAPTIVVQPTHDQVPYSPGSSAVLQVEAVGSGTLSYQWRKDGEDLDGETGKALLLEDLNRVDNGLYSVRVSSEFGETTSVEVQIGVPLKPAGRFPRWASPVSAEISPRALVFGNGRFVAVSGDAPAAVAHSADGVHWTKGTMEDFRSWGGVCFGDDKLVMGGMTLSSSTPAIVYSHDGIAWAVASLPADLRGPVFSVAWGDGVYVATGPGWALRSDDGIMWESASGSEDHAIRTVDFGDGYFLGMSHEGVFRSNDGNAWSPYGDTPGNGRERLRFEGGRWWTVGAGGRPHQSLDGRSWLEVRHEPFTDVLDVNGVMVAAGGTWDVFYGEGADWGANSAGHAVTRLAAGNGRIVGFGEGSVSVRRAEMSPLIIVQPRIIGSSSFAPTTRHAVGARLVLEARAVGAGAHNYQWYKGQSPLPEANEPILVIEDLQREDMGDYYVEVQGAAGKVVSEPVGLRVEEEPFPHPPTSVISTPAGMDLDSIVYGHGRFVAVNRHEIVHSGTGFQWHGGQIPGLLIFSPVVSGASGFLVGGIDPQTSDPVILHSPDGAGWGETTLPDDRKGPIRSIAYGEGIYVASGPPGTFWSDDGTGWERLPDVPSDMVVAFGDGFFLGRGPGALWRSDDGRIWGHKQALGELTPAPSFSGDRWWAVWGQTQSRDGARWVDTGVIDLGNPIFVDGMYAAADLHGNRIYYGSADGADWGSGRFIHQGLSDLTHGGGRIVGTTGTSTWVRTAAHPPSIAVEPSVLRPTVLGGELELEVTALGTEPLRYQWHRDGEILPGQTEVRLTINSLSFEDDGVYTVEVLNPYGLAVSRAVEVQVANPLHEVTAPWRGPLLAPPQSFAGNPEEVVFGNGRFVAAGGSVIYHSRDGLQWRGGRTPRTRFPGGVSFGNETFVAGGFDTYSSRPVIVHSDDGAAWADATLPGELGGPVRAVGWGNGVFVATGNDWTLWSDDGRQWEIAEGATGFSSVAYGNGFFLGVTARGEILKSVNGREWESHAEVGSIALRPQLQFASGQFFLFRSGTTPLESFDGLAWTEVPLDNPSAILATDSMLLAAGGESVHYGTADGAAWASRHVQANNLRSLATGNGRIVAVGSGALLARSATIEPYAADQADPFDAVSGESAVLSVAPIGEAYFFSWYRGDNLVAVTDGPVWQIADVSPEDAGEYRVRVTGFTGSTYSAPFHLVVHTAPSLVAQPGTLFANPGETVTLAVEVEGTEPMDFIWQKDGGAAGQTDEPLLILQNVRAGDAGVYRLTVANPAGSVTSDPMDLRIILSYDDWVEWKAFEGEIPEEHLSPDADMGGTGVSNLLRYALNLAPGTAARDGLPALNVQNDPETGLPEFLLFTFQRRKGAADIELHIEHSVDLGSWTRLAPEDADISVEDDGGVELVTLHYPLREENRFFRLSVERGE